MLMFIRPKNICQCHVLSCFYRLKIWRKHLPDECRSLNWHNMPKHKPVSYVALYCCKVICIYKTNNQPSESNLCSQDLVKAPFSQMTTLWSTRLLWQQPSACLYCWVWCVSSPRWPVKHSGTIVSKPVLSAVGRCQMLLKKETGISIKLVSREKHGVL